MATPTPKEIRDQVHASAELEVAKKLKLLLLKKFPEKAESYTPKEYLEMARQAIGKEGYKRSEHEHDEREVTLPRGGPTFKLGDIDNMIDDDAKKQLGGNLPSQLVPTSDELDEVAMVSTRSVKKATGPLAMIMNFITAFFQAIGDMLSGNMGGKGFFEKIKEHAANNAGNTIGDDMRTGLDNLADRNPGMRKWLDVDKAIDTVKHGARVAAGVDPKDPKNKAELELAAIQSEDVAADVARKRIRDSVAEDILGNVKGAVGVDANAGTVAWLKSKIGLQASPEAAAKITDKITDAVMGVVTKEEYNGKKVADLTPAELKAALKDETRKALQEYQNNIGSVSVTYKPTNAQIEAIVSQMDGYVDKGNNFQMLKDMGKQSRSSNASGSATPLPSAPAAGVDVEKVRAALTEKFESQLKPALVDGLNAAAEKDKLTPPFKTATNPRGIDPETDPFVRIARERFIEKGTRVIAARPDLTASGKEQELSNTILKEMMATKDANGRDDPQGLKFKEEALAKMKLVSKIMENMDTPAKLDAAYTMLPTKVVEPFTKFFENAEVRTALLAGISTSARSVSLAGQPPPTTPVRAAPSPEATQAMQTFIAAGLETALKENTLARNMAAMGGISFDPKAIAESAAKALAPLALAEVKDPAVLKEAVQTQLARDLIITDPALLDKVAGSIATGLLEKTAGHEPTPGDRQRNVEEAFGFAQQKAGAAIAAYKQHVKEDMATKPIWLAPSKFPKIFGLRKIAENSKKAADAVVRGSVSAAVEVAATAVDEDLLKKTIAKAALEAAQANYDGRQFFELSTQQKKDAVALKVQEALSNDDTFWKIFPGKLPVKLADGITKVDLTNDVKARVVDKIVAQVQNNVATPPSSTAPAAFQLNAALPKLESRLTR